MKRLELHDTVVSVGEETIGTAELIKACLNNVPQGGLTPTDMRERLRILDQLDGANGVLDLEDADAVVLQRCVGQMRWTVVDRGIVEFCDAIDAMKGIGEKREEGLDGN